MPTLSIGNYAVQIPERMSSEGLAVEEGEWYAMRIVDETYEVVVYFQALCTEGWLIPSEEFTVSSRQGFFEGIGRTLH